jgi:phosphoribosylformylglycinamidine cyclo-ligase
VAMCANDVVVQGAEPLFFLDYYVCERLDVRVAAEVVKGIAAGCELAGCALVGGETAEHPKAFIEGEYDLAGFCVGVVEKERIIDGRSVAAGDVLLGLAASGAHANGYSLIRRIIGERPLEAERARALLEPTRIYVKPLLQLAATLPVKALAHITGGGIVGNVPRVLPPGTRARIDSSMWPRPELFRWLQQEGRVSEAEMWRVFNCGIGMVVIVAPGDAAAARAFLEREGEQVYEIGVIERASGEPQALIT